jgi:hypothetical protein
MPMDAPSRLRWLRAVLFVGVVYLVAGLTFGALAGQTASTQMRVTWRLAAWLISGVAFAAHIAYEQIRLRSTPGTTALHASLAPALGAFGLAVAANVHAQAASVHRPAHTLALVLWPVLTALPAFVVALAAAAGLALARRAH